MLPRVSAWLFDTPAPRGIACLRIAPSVLSLPLRVFALASHFKAQRSKAAAWHILSLLPSALPQRITSHRSKAAPSLTSSQPRTAVSLRSCRFASHCTSHQIAAAALHPIAHLNRCGPLHSIALCCPEHCQCQAHHSVAHRVLAFRSPCLFEQCSTLPRQCLANRCCARCLTNQCQALAQPCRAPLCNFYASQGSSPTLPRPRWSLQCSALPCPCRSHRR